MPTREAQLPLLPLPLLCTICHLLCVKIIKAGAAIMWLRHVRDHVVNVGQARCGSDWTIAVRLLVWLVVCCCWFAGGVGVVAVSCPAALRVVSTCVSAAARCEPATPRAPPAH